MILIRRFQEIVFEANEEKKNYLFSPFQPNELFVRTQLVKPIKVTHTLFRGF